MMGKNRKRNREDYEESDNLSTDIGMGHTLSVLREAKAFPAAEGESEPIAPHHQVAGAERDDQGGEWLTAEGRKSKKPKNAEKHGKNDYPVIKHSSQARLQSQVKIGDLQALVLYLLADGPAPQWVAVRHHTAVRKVVVLMVPGLDADMFRGEDGMKVDEAAGDGDVADKKPVTAADEASKDQESHTKASEPPEKNGWNVSCSPDDYYPVELVDSNLPEALKPLSTIFTHLWPVKTPGDERYSKIHSPLQAMLVSALPKPKDERKGKGPQPPREGKDWQNKRTPITNLVASLEELQESEFPIHPVYLNSPGYAPTEKSKVYQSQEDGWVSTDVKELEEGNVPEEEIEQGSVTAGREVISLDCEMCKTEGDTFDLTRISIVRWDDSVLMDELVKPEREITDYLTPYSGITKEMLEPVTTTLGDIQARLLKILTPRTILVGHSLNSDLAALKLTHPFIVDTSIAYPHPRGLPLKSSLKWLSQKYLGREIQKSHGSLGHDSVEDARAGLDLIKQKCEKGSKWGTSEATGESIFKRLGRSAKPRRSRTSGALEQVRTGAVVDWGDPRRGFGSNADVCIGCENDDEVVAGVRRAVLGESEPDSSVPPGGVDLVWARLRSLEAMRGWWNRAKTVDNAEMLANALAESAAENVAEVERGDVDGEKKTKNGDGPVIENGQTERDSSPLTRAVARTVAHISDIHLALPPCTAFIVYSGSGDPRETARLQALQQQFKKEYAVKKWDELSVRWTDVEEQALRTACRKARDGIGFVVVK